MIFRAACGGIMGRQTEPGEAAAPPASCTYRVFKRYFAALPRVAAGDGSRFCRGGAAAAGKRWGIAQTVSGIHNQNCFNRLDLEVAPRKVAGTRAWAAEAPQAYRQGRGKKEEKTEARTQVGLASTLRTRDGPGKRSLARRGNGRRFCGQL